MALAHHGFGEAAHQEVHQAGAAVGAQHQQVRALLAGIIHQFLRHFARAFIGQQQVGIDAGDARFRAVCNFHGFGKHLVAVGNGGFFITGLLQEFGSQSHIFGGVGHMDQSQFRFARGGYTAGMSQGIDGSFAAVYRYHQMFIHNTTLLHEIIKISFTDAPHGLKYNAARARVCNFSILF